jgi:CubicO group peptidase (beta-lactamase class C family)
MNALVRRLPPLTLAALALLLAAALPFVPPAAAAEAAAFAGHFEGSIDVPGHPLKIDVDLAVGDDGSLSGDISIPAQAAKDLPLAGFAIDGDAVTFAIRGIPGDPTFHGTLAADGSAIAGDFTQGGGTFPFSLARAEAPAAAARGALDDDFAEFADAARESWEAPGLALAVVKDGEVVFARGFGRRDVDGKLPVTPDTLFAIGSSTKAFTTFVLGTLVDEGKLDWDKPVKTYLPGFQLYDEVTTDLITPRDLVTHRSGLPRHDLVWYNAQELPRQELVARLAYLEPNETLRNKFQYNNLMFLTAGYLAEVITGKSWEDDVRERIFAPLGMERSTFTVEAMQQDPDFALPYEERDDKVVRVPYRPIGNMGPAGSIDSSADEMARWMEVHLADGRYGDRRLIAASTLAEIHSPQIPLGTPPERPEISPTSYGMGWFVDVYRGHPRVFHGGNIDGFSALVTLFPQDGLGIVALTNKGASGLPSVVTLHAADRLLGLEPIDWNREGLARRAQGQEATKEAKERKEIARRPGTMPAHPLAEYAGRYTNPGYGDLDVAVEGDHLSLTFHRITTPLEHWHYEVWNAPEGAADPVFEGLKFRFETDVRGYVAALHSQFEPRLDELVFKRQPDPRYFDPDYLRRFTGAYDLSGQVVTIALVGDTLTASIPGQPLYHLRPVLGDEFVLAEVAIISARFVTGEGGEVTGLQVSQPQGVFEATRRPE